MKSFFKRLFDIVSSFFGIIFLLPVLLPIMLILLLTGEHQVFYLQNRIGFKGKPFKIWKFTTMLKNSEKQPGGDITLRNDPRVTPIGRFLRKSKINEFPQLINVFIGDMSIVGPRPLMAIHYEEYPEGIKEKVYNFKPGITGIGSIVLRDEEKLLSDSQDPRKFMTKILMPFKGSLELWYQENYSFKSDILIIFLTFWVVVSPESDLPYKFFKTLPERPDALTY